MKAFYLFYGGEASQWYNSSFEFSEYSFNCAEQFMMSAKAKLFKDDEMFDNIMNSNNPKSQKAYGRMIKNFDNEKWMEYAKDIVIVGNSLKFYQNDYLHNWLQSIKSEYRWMVETSPYDKIWGIGLSEDDPRCQNKEFWKGANLLGECIDQAYVIIDQIDNNKPLDDLELNRFHKVADLFK